jgi:hypothetical protein
MGMSQTSQLIRQPIFLVGSERSGTTLLRIMLDSHPQLAFFFEFEYAVELMPDSPGWPDMREYLSHLETDRIFQLARERLELTIDPGLDYPHLVDSFLRQKRDHDGKSLVGATIHYNFDRVLRIWPDARFIHLIRDGRDVGRSFIDLGWAGNMYAAVQKWIEAEMLWAKLSGGLPADRWFEVRYETLVTEPEALLTQICAFVGLPYDPAMFDYTKNGSTYDQPSPRMIDQWKRKLTPEQVRLAEARIGGMLVERGYELSGYPPLEVPPAMRRRLQIQNRWSTAMQRRRRFGTALFLADAFTRRLGPRIWQDRVRMRLNK